MGKYDKVTDTEIKLLIISKSITIISFVEFIDQLIDYSINCASLSVDPVQMPQNAVADLGLHYLLLI